MLFWVGILIVVLTHIGMLLNVLPMMSGISKMTHAIANLIAAGLIVYDKN